MATKTPYMDSDLQILHIMQKIDEFFPGLDPQKRIHLQNNLDRLVEVAVNDFKRELVWMSDRSIVNEALQNRRKERESQA